MQDKVLIIEDSRSFSSILGKVLAEHAQVEFDVAETKRQAETLIESNAANYLAAIVDLNLPDAPHGEATDLVVKADIPAIVFTSTNDRAVKEDLWARGISDYAHKAGAHSLEYICWIINRLRKNKTVKVLVVDDALSAQLSMEQLLKTQRLQVLKASNGEDALALIDANPDISVAIVDAYMDEMNGFELSTKLREKRSRDLLEIVGVSAKKGRDISAQFIKAGANDYLHKPFIPEEFLCRINHAIENVERYEQLRSLNLAKNQLLGTAAHDIRGPVGAIKTAADYIINRDPKPERKASLIQMIESSASGVLSLLSDLLDVSAIEGGELKLNLCEEDFTKLVEERLELYVAKAEEKEIELSSDLENSVIWVIDAIKIRQAIDNLLTNAIKYSPIGGKIEVSLSLTNDSLEFRVNDSGPGISEEERKDLFKPFKVLSSKTTAGEKATGLGLAIAKNVVKAHGGQIKYEDSALGGAAFCISIPKHAS